MNYYFAVYECDENGDELDHLKNFKSEEKAIAYCDKLDFNSHVVIMPPPGFDEGNSEDMEEWDSDYEPYEVIYDNFEKVRNNSKKRRGNTPYTNYMRDIFPNEEEWEKWRSDCVNFFNKWQDTCIKNGVRIYDLIDYLVNAIIEILNINKQDRRGLWDVEKCCYYLMFGPDINSAAYKELVNAVSTNDVDDVIKKYGKTAEDYNGLLSIKNSVIKSSINNGNMNSYYAIIPRDAEKDGSVIYFNDGDAWMVLQKRDEDGNILAEKEIELNDVLQDSSFDHLDNIGFEYDDNGNPVPFEQLSKENQDYWFNLALQYKQEWGEDSDPEVREMSELDPSDVAVSLYEEGNNI